MVGISWKYKMVVKLLLCYRVIWLAIRCEIVDIQQETHPHIFVFYWQIVVQVFNKKFQ